MNREDIYQERAACPVYTAIGVIEGRWKPMIFQRLALHPHGFGELRRAMPSVSIKVLREQFGRCRLTACWCANRSHRPAKVCAIGSRLTVAH